jgi:hypothetical protein
MPPRLLLIILLILPLGATPAAAQDPDQRFSAGIAAGVATPFHGDFDFTAISWQGDVRINTARHLALDLFVEEWRHTIEEVRTNRTLIGPDGPIGHVDRFEERTDHLTRTVGASLLGRGTSGRITFTGGGGISYLSYSRDFSQRSTGCDPASLCSDFSHEFGSGNLAAQVQAGLDVAVAPHVALMGQFRLVVAVDDPGFGHNSFVAGVRFGL